MGNTSSRQNIYQDYHNSLQHNNITNSTNSMNYENSTKDTIDLKNIDMKKLNHYEVLNLKKNFTWEELKDAYKKLAINTHPDKPGGNKDLFSIITYSFKKLAIEYKKRNSDLEHYELKKQSTEYFHKMTSETTPHPSDILSNNRDEAFSTKFNRNFEKCKVYDDDIDFGYGEKMQISSKIREDINIEKVIKKDKIDNETFNNLFNKNVPINKQLVKYKEPEPLLMAKTLNFTELGSKKSDDYTCTPEKSKILAYTDYMKAHDGSRLVDTSIINNNKTFKNIDEYKKYSDSKIEKQLSQKELKNQELKRIKEEKEEMMRLKRLEKYDKRIEKSYNKANKLFLN
jgi:curved DNA-binding protein CbpA